MTTTANESMPEVAVIEADLSGRGCHHVSLGRRVRDKLATVWMIGSVIIAVIPLMALVIHVARTGARVMSFGFLTKPLPIVTSLPGGGVAPAIVGTAVITGTAALLAVPPGILAAIYLNEYGRQGRLARVLRFFAEVMSGVPSIVMGLFIFTLFTLRQGLSGFGGALALGCLMLPIVIRSTEEMLRLVPDELRQGSLALGCPQWRTIVSVVLPAALPGIVSGVMLAIARASGETAPLLLTIGVTSKVNADVFHGTNTTLSYQIYSNANQVFDAAKNRAWGAALTLIVIVLLCSLAARMVAARFRHDYAGF
jgi:phosphate transport system permease protein